ncbi:hypothetical protein EXIGLDRAFT_831945 [Exidia glandulosa HHB12029]|uniref:Integral membrane protein n=1 Tax=Exidia glandulosa HHB12029 TaxID=1314781 RepID=A0A165M3K8_EXIGL|nr:hypothetical protein EXIGLDRAFT_831945 [Exidia glandulosa HHB12029]
MSTGAALRAGGWDPVLLVSQIILLQTVHYLALSILTPFAAGGVPAVGLVMDWRELAGATVGDAAHGGGTAYAGGKALGTTGGVQVVGSAQDAPGAHAWGLAACWMIAALVDVWVIYVFVRRPRLVLDFALTLAGAHLVLTTYYAGSLPHGLFTWLTYGAFCGATVILGEQACVRREMDEGIRIVSNNAEDVELGALPAHEAA